MQISLNMYSIKYSKQLYNVVVDDDDKLDNW